MKKNEIIRKIFQLKTIAVVGLSPNKVRPSHYVSTYMRNNGYNIIPVNPGHNYIEGVRCYPNLESIKKDVDIINIFRKSEFVPDIVRSAILIKSKAIWMQDSIFHNKAAKNAKDAGLMVVMNDCILRQHKRITGVT